MNRNKFETEFGRAVPMTRLADYQGRYRAAFETRLEQLAAKLTRTYQQNRNAGDLAVLVERARVKDAWDTPVTVARWGGTDGFYYVSSAGADRRFGTQDDMATYLQVQKTKAAGPPLSPGSRSTSRWSTIAARSTGARKSRAPWNAANGTVVMGATVTLREAAGGAVRTGDTEFIGAVHAGRAAGGRVHGGRRGAGLQGGSAEGCTAGTRSSGVVGGGADRRGGRHGGGVNVVQTPGQGQRRSVVGDRRAEDAGVVGGVPGGMAGGVIGGSVDGPRQVFDMAMPMAAPPASRRQSGDGDGHGDELGHRG